MQAAELVARFERLPHRYLLDADIFFMQFCSIHLPLLGGTANSLHLANPSEEKRNGA